MRSSVVIYTLLFNLFIYSQYSPVPLVPRNKSTHTGTQHSSCDFKRVLSVSKKFITQASAQPVEWNPTSLVDIHVYVGAWRDFPPTRAENNNVELE